MPRWIFALVQFLPLSLFASYAFWYGTPEEARWQQAFQLASVAALLQLAIVLPQRRPASRLVLAANLYLLLGGLAFFAHQWWFLQLYDALRESAIFIIMLAVGIVTTVGSRSGFVAACSMPRHAFIRPPSGFFSPPPWLSPRRSPIVGTGTWLPCIPSLAWPSCSGCCRIALAGGTAQRRMIAPGRRRYAVLPDSVVCLSVRSAGWLYSYAQLKLNNGIP